METFTKQSAESYPVAIDFREKMPPGATLLSMSVSAIDTSTNADATGTVLQSATASISGNQATFKVQAGTDGHKYKISGLATLSNGGPLKEDLIMIVSDL